VAADGPRAAAERHAALHLLRECISRRAGGACTPRGVSRGVREARLGRRPQYSHRGTLGHATVRAFAGGCCGVRALGAECDPHFRLGDVGGAAVGIAQRSGRVRFRYRPAQQRPGRQHGAPRGSPHRIRELRICDRREMSGDVEGRCARGFARADHSATGEYRATVVAAGDRDNGAGARDQAGRGRRQQRVGNRARDQRVCTTTQWRPAGAAGKSRPRERRCDRRVGRAASAAGDVHASHRDVRRRPDVLRYRYRRPLPPRLAAGDRIS
jgi:hypothetical protein